MKTTLLSLFALTTIFSSDSFALSTFDEIRYTLRNHLHTGFSGVNNPGDQNPCEVKIAYGHEQILVSINGHHPDGEPAKLKMVFDAQDSTLGYQILGNSHEDMQIKMSYGDANPRVLTMTDHSISVKTPNSELTCWPKK